MVDKRSKSEILGLETVGANPVGPAARPSVKPPSPGHQPDLRRLARGSQFPIVAIGASAGGLEAMAQLLDALPPDSGMAFILVQHLDPTHKSLMVELLSTHSKMQISQVTDGMSIEPNQVYVSPPGHFLSARFGLLHITLPQGDKHARLPIDYLIRSLVDEHAARTICVILSGTGTDGSGALAELKRGGGHVLVQDPDEADYDGMPRSAILTGMVDAVAKLADLPDRLAEVARTLASGKKQARSPAPPGEVADVAAIVRLLQHDTDYDFTSYKHGTLERRIQRRMGLVGVRTGDFAQYLQLLRANQAEREQLAEDILINVTSFFRDPQVFDLLDQTVIPDLIKDIAPDQALRIWVAGCSSGEEAYSIAMICRDAIVASGRDIKLQIFASDVDARAIAAAREGFYPLSIEQEVSADRLRRFFLKEETGYRVSSALRGTVVFNVQDVLHDPPFSRIDLVSCRNLLIYLNQEAQTKVISLFHFALRARGILVLGSAETPGDAIERFKVLHKAERIYRHTMKGRPGETGFPLSFVESIPRLTAKESSQQLSRQTVLADLCRNQVVTSFAPASVLVNAQQQCIYTLGPVNRFLRIAAGHPTMDLLDLAAPNLRTTLRNAIRKVDADHPHFNSGMCQTDFDGKTIAFSIDVQFLRCEDENLHLVSFLEEKAAPPRLDRATNEADSTRILSLERELEISNVELQRTIRSRDALILEQKAINDEAQSVNEEFQSTNEELLTSKEELQSLNEELIALNGQLQETLERQRTTSDDLQNVLYSTNVATLFLDLDMRIRFFTPATRAIFKVIPGDIGRPLGDLNSFAADDSLLKDAHLVLEKKNTIEREIGAPGDLWYLRRIFPYRAHDASIEGVVITFVDITDSRKVADALEQAKLEAERSNLSKSRFLAAASHDLRQPLQSMKLIQELLTLTVAEEEPKKLIARLSQSLDTMAIMLDSLLDINQIETGVLGATITTFPVASVLDRLRAEFGPLAQARNLTLHVAATSAVVRSDALLLEQMLRNLLANALKYTEHGKIVLGCRHADGALRIEVWDSGIGIAEDDLDRIFDEFHQVGNPARERKRGLGLGLSIVRRLGNLLGHPVHVRSLPGKGSVFCITVPTGAAEASGGDIAVTALPTGPASPATASRAIVIVEDDPDVLGLLEQLLKAAGHSVTAAADGPVALEMVAEGPIRPELILTDYNLPNGMNGLEVLAAIRAQMKQDIPGIVLTGDISRDALAAIKLEDCILLSKPVSGTELHAAISTLTPDEPGTRRIPGQKFEDRRMRIICVVDDDADIRESLRAVLEHDDRSVDVYPSAEAFLASHVQGRDQCLLVDACLPGMGGVELIRHLRQQGDPLAAIVITGSGEIAMAVQAMRSGASDFIEKPVGRAELIASIDRAISQQQGSRNPQSADASDAAKQLSSLTKRQKTILDMVLAGQPSKNIAADLAISQRTVENHRAEIMHKLGVRSIPDLVRLVLSATAALDHG